MNYFPLWQSDSSAKKKTPVQSSKKIYSHAQEKYYDFFQSSSNVRKREQWIGVINGFLKVLKFYPDSPEAYKATFTIARLFHKMGHELKKVEDFRSAQAYYQKLLGGSRKGSLHDDSLFHLAEIFLKQKQFDLAHNNFQTIIKKYPKGDQINKAREKLSQVTASNSKSYSKKINKIRRKTLSNLVFSRNEVGSRLTLSSSGVINFRQAKLSNPDRVLLTFENATWDKSVVSSKVIKGSIVEKWKLGVDKNSNGLLELKINSKDGARIVTRKQKNNFIIEFQPLKKKVVAKKSPNKNHKKPLAKIKKVSVRKNKVVPSQVPSKIEKGSVPLIVLDAGHGGKDDGAHGVSGVLEKKLNLDIAKKVGALLTKRYKYKILLTRKDDTFIELEERGNIANKMNADLFVSIHANAAPRKSAKGIETYYLGTGSSKQALETAARENGDLVHSVSDNDVQNILASLISTSKINHSSRFAATVQKRLFKNLTKKYRGVNNLGVKEGPFVVLHHTNMPSILVEVGFVTNKSEERKLKNKKYQDRLASAIAQGIHDYILQRGPSI